MKLQIVNRSIDRQLLMAMVTSSTYLREVRDLYSPSFFSATFMQIVAGWCFDYFKKYGEAPGRHIQDVFDSAVRGELDKQIRPEELELIQKFLVSLSSEYDQSVSLNVPFLLDETIRWWKKQDLKVLLREVDDLLNTATPQEAEDLLRQHQTLTRTIAEGLDVFNEPEKLKVLFEDEDEPLIEYGGAMGEIINPWMTRDQLIGVLAPPKGGKTADLVETCIRGVASRANVALFETGDLSEKQGMARIFSNLTERCNHKRFLGEHLVCVPDCWGNQIGTCTKRCRTWHGSIRGGYEDPFPEVVHPNFSPCTVCAGTRDYEPCYARVPYNCKETYTPKMIESTRRKMADYMGNRKFRVHTSPNSTISVGGIDNVLKQWKESYGFIPDVIVIDYADILAPEESAKGSDERTRQNHRWQQLRRLSQTWHALVIVATQSDAAGFGKEDLDFSNFSEDMRKYAHVTGMLAIHQTEYEKKIGVCRMSWILGRDGQPDRMHQAVILHNHYVGRFHVDSFLRTSSYRAEYETGDDDGHSM